MSDRPPLVAVITAAIFRLRNIVLLFVAFTVAKVLGLGLITAGGVALLTYGAGIGQSTGDRAFLEEVQSRRQPLLDADPDRPQIASSTTSPAGLTGKYRASFDRVAQLKSVVERDVKALPTGPLTESLGDFLPQLDDVIPEVQKLLAKAQSAERELTGGASETLKKEVGEVEARLAAATDPEVRAQLETALARKKEALGHMDGASAAMARIEAQVEAIASGLQEAHARLAALAADTESLDASPARQAVEGISRDVKFLAQAVQDTEKLLGPAKGDAAWDSGRGSNRSSMRT